MFRRKTPDNTGIRLTHTFNKKTCSFERGHIWHYGGVADQRKQRAFFKK